jgi:hypothetical protein
MKTTSRISSGTLHKSPRARSPAAAPLKAAKTTGKISYVFIVRSAEFGLAPGSAIIAPTLAAAKQLRERGLFPVKLNKQIVQRIIIAKEQQSGEAEELAKKFRLSTTEAKRGTRRVRRRTPPDKAAFPSKSEVPLLPTISESAFALSPRAKALLRGRDIVEQDLRSSGGSFDLEEVRRLMHGVSRQRIDRRVREGSLLAVPGPSNKRHYPAIQFTDDGTVVEGLQAVREALPTKNGFAILNFLIHPDRRLANRKPIDLLKAGEIDLVVEAARHLGEQGA